MGARKKAKDKPSRGQKGDKDQDQDQEQNNNNGNEGPPKKKQKVLDRAVEEADIPDEHLCENPGCTTPPRPVYNARSGPSGKEALCRPCYQRWGDHKRKQDKAQTPYEDGWRTATNRKLPPNTPCQNPGCGNDATKQKILSSGREPLCVNCYNRWIKHKSERDKAQKPYDDSWRTVQRRNFAPGTPCQTPGCSNTAIKRKVTPSSTEALCSPCYSKWWRYKTKQDADQKPYEDDWRTSTRGRQHGGGGEPRCRDCATCLDLIDEDDVPYDTSPPSVCRNCYRRLLSNRPRPFSNSEISINDVSYSYTRLVDLAARSWQDMCSGNRVLPPQDYGGNYMHDSGADLHEQAADRGFGRGLGTGAPINVIIDALRLDDAANGLLPVPLTGASIYHTMHAKERTELAHSRGYPREASTQAANVIEYLVNNDPIEADIIAMDEESARLVRSLLQEDSAGTGGVEATHRTHVTTSEGAVGSREAMLSLQQAVSEQLFPTNTPSEGLLCGPNALAASLNAMLSRLGHDVRVDSDQLMRLVIPSFDREDFEDRENGTINADEVGAEYYAWYQRTYAGDESIDENVRQQQFTDITRVRDIDYQQLIGMLVVGNETGILPAFALGIITSSYIGTDGNEVRATARLLHQPQPDSPTIWLHNNVNYGQGMYNHWEGFTGGEGSRMYDAIAWGFRILSTDILPARPGVRFQNVSRNVEADLRRKKQNAEQQLNYYLARTRLWCRPCVEQGRDECETIGDQEHCSNCVDNPELCIYARSKAERAKLQWIPANELTENDLRPWDKPLSLDALAEQMENQAHFRADPEPEERHILIVSTARMSSRRDPGGVVQLMNDVVSSVNTYGAVLDNPNDHASPEIGPALAGVLRRIACLVFARHGTRAVPYQIANLQDPVLVGFVQLIHSVTRPGNPNPPGEIHLLMHGLAGFAVGVRAWGSRQYGFYKFLLDQDAANPNGISIADRVFLVPIVEEHVVDGLGAHCLDAHTQARPGLASPHWYQPVVPPRTKYLAKHSLTDVVDRTTQLEAHCAQFNLSLEQAMTPGPATPALPMYPIFGVNVDKLDRFILASYDEQAWRSGWCTLPQAAIVDQRNDNRNRPFL